MTLTDYNMGRVLDLVDEMGVTGDTVTILTGGEPAALPSNMSLAAFDVGFVACWC